MKAILILILLIAPNFAWGKKDDRVKYFITPEEDFIYSTVKNSQINRFEVATDSFIRVTYEGDRIIFTDRKGSVVLKLPPVECGQPDRGRNQVPRN